jgi:hypothetical protein
MSVHKICREYPPALRIYASVFLIVFRDMGGRILYGYAAYSIFSILIQPYSTFRITIELIPLLKSYKKSKMLNLEWSQSIQNYSVTDKFLREIYPVLCWTCGAILSNLKVSFLTSQ